MTSKILFLLCQVTFDDCDTTFKRFLLFRPVRCHLGAVQGFASAGLSSDLKRARPIGMRRQG
jgi:hypothetical protein